jgi:hypothetical protein
VANEYVADTGGLDGHIYDRQAVGLHLGALAVKTTGAQVRGGVVPANGTPLGYVATTGLNATLKAGTYLLPVSDASLGPVEVVVPADQTFTHDTAHASQPRADLIIVEVVDNGDNTSTKKVRILKGTAGSGSPDPTLPSSLGNGAVVAIHRVLIPAASATLSTITDLRTFTAGAGGAVRLANVAAASTLPEGTPFYAEDTDTLGWKTAASTELYRRSAGGLYSGTTNFEGKQNIAHGLGATPSKLSVTTATIGFQATDNVTLVKVTSVDSSTIGVQLYRTDTSTTLNLQLFSCYWFAEL